MVAGALPAPAPICSPSGHARPFSETEQRIRALLDAVPITRVYDATALDRLNIPVAAAVTPLARDLTVHAGKGISPQAARISAVMEAIERVCAEEVVGAAVRRATLQALRADDQEPVLDPRSFDLPYGTTFSPQRECAWVQGEDLLAGGPVWVARDLVVSPAVEGVASGVETNGLAAGNLPVEAILHGLYEVIERDAAAVRRFRRRYGEGAAMWSVRLIAQPGLPAPAAAWAQQLAGAGIALTIEEITSDIAVPVYRTTLHDRAFPGHEGQTVNFEGFGADLDAEHALVRSICEAAQSHTGLLVGARDAFEDGGAGASRTAGRLLEILSAPATTVPFEASAALPADLNDRLATVLDRIRAAGFAHCVAVDLTRPDLGIPVVRVLAPGAAGPYGETSRRPGRRLLRWLVR